MEPTKWKLYESSLIKAIRRSQPDNAAYWAGVLWRLNKADVIWRRLFIHLSEDIGIADRTLPSNIEALYQNYTRLTEPGETSYESEDIQKLPLIHAVILLATAPKSRAIGCATIIHAGQEPIEEREPPSYATDFHSPMGRRLGRDLHHFWNEAGKLEDIQGRDVTVLERQWERQAHTILAAREDSNEPPITPVTPDWAYGGDPTP